MYKVRNLRDDVYLFRSPGNAYVEGDASSASYFLAGAAITGGTITVEGCGTSSLQVNMAPLYLFQSDHKSYQKYHVFV